MLDPASASDQLRNYESNLGKELNIGQCILRFLFPDEGRLAMVLRWLNSQANLHVWEIAHRIPPPEFFYKAHPEILEACKLCGGQLVCEPYFDLEPGLRSIRHSISFLLVNSKAGPRSGRSDKEGVGTRPRAAVAWAAGTIASSATYLPVSYHLRAVQARVPARR